MTAGGDRHGQNRGVTRWPPIRLIALTQSPPATSSFSHLPRVPAMASNSQQQKRRDNVLSSLNVAIDALDITKEILSGTPAKAVCGPVSVILTMIKVRPS